MKEITFEQSGAFIERFIIEPTRAGMLDGFSFAVKDLVDVVGHATGGGNPARLAAAPPAAVSAICVEQLLAAGARCVGKTITDELAYSLLGENHHYGTPLNPKSPDRVPGGSSSGSASAVACGLVDFAIGTDTGGSVRVPSSNCGIWGWRPTYGAVSVAGVMPLAPSFDTVGILARDSETLRQSGMALLGDIEPQRGASLEIGNVFAVKETFAFADEQVRIATSGAVREVERALGASVEQMSLTELCDDGAAADFDNWLEVYRKLVSAEAMSCHGAWLETAQPELGPMTAMGFTAGRALDRSRLGAVIARRERYCRRLRRRLGPRDLLVMPTTPSVAPLRGTSSDRNSDYYRRTLSFNAIGGVGRLPQVTMPLAHAEDVPVGLSILGAGGEDAFLLEAAQLVGRLFAAN